MRAKSESLPWTSEDVVAVVDEETVALLYTETGREEVTELVAFTSCFSSRPERGEA